MATTTTFDNDVSPLLHAAARLMSCASMLLEKYCHAPVFDSKSTTPPITSDARMV